MGKLSKILTDGFNVVGQSARKAVAPTRAERLESARSVYMREVRSVIQDAIVFSDRDLASLIIDEIDQDVARVDPVLLDAIEQLGAMGVSKEEIRELLEYAQKLRSAPVPFFPMLL